MFLSVISLCQHFQRWGVSEGKVVQGSLIVWHWENSSIFVFICLFLTLCYCFLASSMHRNFLIFFFSSLFPLFCILSLLHCMIFLYFLFPAFVFTSFFMRLQILLLLNRIFCHYFFPSIIHWFLRFEVFTAVTMKNVIFWNYAVWLLTLMPWENERFSKNCSYPNWH
jgi:hypothetical protein